MNILFTEGEILKEEMTENERYFWRSIENYNVVQIYANCGCGRDTLLERIHKEISLNLKQGKVIKCIHITKEDFDEIIQGNIFIISLEMDKATLFGYPIKEDFMTFIE